jgi:hypothetical protein
MMLAKLSTELLETLAPHFRPPNFIVVTGLTNTGKAAVINTLAREALRYLLPHQLEVHDDWNPVCLRDDNAYGTAAAELHRMLGDTYRNNKVTILGIAQRPLRARGRRDVIPNPLFNTAYSTEPAMMAGLVLYTERTDTGLRLRVLKDRHGDPRDLGELIVESLPQPWQVLAPPR